MRAWFSSGQAWTNPCQSSECCCSDFGAGEEVWEMRWELCQTTTSANSVVLISFSFESQVQRLQSEHRDSCDTCWYNRFILSFFHSFFSSTSGVCESTECGAAWGSLAQPLWKQSKKHTTWKQPLVGRRATCFLVFSSFSWKSCSWYAKRKLLTPCQLVFHHCKNLSFDSHKLVLLRPSLTQLQFSRHYFLLHEGGPRSCKSHFQIDKSIVMAV